MLVYRFGPFEFDPASGCLFRNGKRLLLSDAQAAILKLLIASTGEIVEREALIKAAWGNTAISETSLTQAIKRLRQILGAGPKGAPYIETRNTCGYRFAVVVQRVPRAERDDPAASLDAELARYGALVRMRADLETLDPEAIRSARPTLARIVREMPNDAAVHLALAMACALEYEATTPDPDPDVAALALGLEHTRIGCRLDPLSGRALNTLALLRHLNGDSAEAAAAACKAGRLEPDNLRHGLMRGYVSWGDARLEAANRVLAMDPGSVPAHWLKAGPLIARGAFPAAEEALRLGCAAQDAQPKRARLGGNGLHLLDGLVHARHGRLDEAIAAFMRELPFADATQIYGRGCAANTWYAIGAVKRRQQKPMEAQDAYERALAIAPCHTSAAAALGADALTKAIRRSHVPASASIDADIGRSVWLTLDNRPAEAAQVYYDAVAKAPPGPLGWLLPVEPILNPYAHPDKWAETLALVRLRAL